MDRIEDFEVNSPRWLSLEDFDGEIWKDIPEYEGLYKVSNYGRIKSLERRWFATRNFVSSKEKILRQNAQSNYYNISLSKEGKAKNKNVHRLVAKTFIENPLHFPYINHKDENKLNNCVWNLEWCTAEYNTNYGTGIQRRTFKQINRKDISKPVFQYTQDGLLVARFPSMKEAERSTGILVSSIQSACLERRSVTAGGYIWSHTNNPKDLERKIERAKFLKQANSPKEVCRYTLQGDYIDEFPSIIEAANKTGICSALISACCRHYKNFRSAGRYKWEYKNNPNRDNDAKRTFRHTYKRK